MPEARPLGRRELGLAAVAALLLAAAMWWPLPLHLGRDVPKDLGDPLAQAWQLAWGGHALVHQPLQYFQSNQFWPLSDTLAFSDALAGLSPLALGADGARDAILRYDLAFLLAYALAALGAYALARELGLRPAAAAVAAAAYAYAPYRLEQMGHLHVLSSGGIPLALALLVGGWRRERPGLVVAGGAVAAWQVSIGWTLGLQLGTLLAVLGVGAALAWWWSAAKPGADRRLLRATVLAGVVLLAASAVLARPYLRVAHDHPEAKRGAALVAAYSAGPRMFLAASPDSTLWGGLTAPVRDGLQSVPEQTLFPGVAILALALLGAVRAPWPRRLRLGLAAGTVLLAVASLGMPSSGWRLLTPYGLLYELVPGWQAVRVPERLMTLTTLGLALLAAGGAAWLLSRRRAPRLLGPLLVALVLLDGAGFGTAQPRAPEPPAGLAAAGPPPLLELPARAEDNRRYLLWSTDGFPPMANGRSSYNPPSFTALVAAAAPFPDRASVARLRAAGIRTVVIHRDRAAGTPWQDAERRPVAGLGLAREVRGRLAVYRLRTG